jgi:hypothetical protein
MVLSSVPSYKIVKGWFNETLSEFVPPCPIAVLRLDGDLPLRLCSNMWLMMGTFIDDYYA